MPLRIRLRRTGRKKQPHWRIVVTHGSKSRDGRFVETLGYYRPLSDPARLVVDLERADYWIGNGALPSDTVNSLLKKARRGGDESVVVGEPEEGVTDKTSARGEDTVKPPEPEPGEAEEPDEVEETEVAGAEEPEAEADEEEVAADEDAGPDVGPGEDEEDEDEEDEDEEDEEDEDDEDEEDEEDDEEDEEDEEDDEEDEEDDEEDDDEGGDDDDEKDE